MDRSLQLFGTGLRFPFAHGHVDPWIRGPEVVAQALESILLTQPGERIARPNYGAGLRRFLFEPNELATRTAIRAAVEEAVVRDEPRVELRDVRVETDAHEPTLLRIELSYALVGERTPRNLVFPFYLDAEVA